MVTNDISGGFYLVPLLAVPFFLHLPIADGFTSKWQGGGDHWQVCLEGPRARFEPSHTNGQEFSGWSGRKGIQAERKPQMKACGRGRWVSLLDWQAGCAE